MSCYQLVTPDFVRQVTLVTKNCFRFIFCISVKPHDLCMERAAQKPQILLLKLFNFKGCVKADHCCMGNSKQNMLLLIARCL